MGSDFGAVATVCVRTHSVSEREREREENRLPAQFSDHIVQDHAILSCVDESIVNPNTGQRQLATVLAQIITRRSLF